MRTLLLAMLLASCGAVEVPDYQIDATLKPYVAEFYADAAARGKIGFPGRNLRIIKLTAAELHNTESVLGICSTWTVKAVSNSVEWREIWIHDPVSPHLLRAVMYHELGHCLLGLEHGTGIMNAYIGADLFAADWVTLVNQLLGD